METRPRSTQTEVTTFGGQLGILHRDVDRLRELHTAVWDDGKGSITPEDVVSFRDLTEKINRLIETVMEDGVTPSQSKYFLINSTHLDFHECKMSCSLDQ